MEKQYLDLLRKIQAEGTYHEDRTGTGTTRIFGSHLRFDLSKGFPLLTTKKVWWKGVVEELLWILSGSTDVKDLQRRGVGIWDKWATAEKCAKFGREEGDLGPVYGWQWRNFGGDYTPGRSDLVTNKGVDQIANVVDLLVNSPNSRRIILSGWNPKDATEVELPPCHTLTQFSVINGKLSALMYQRSADMFLGVPFNIASYSLLIHMLAKVTGLGVGEFIHTFGDAHIYKTHEDQVAEQLSREPRPFPKLKIGMPGNAIVYNPNESRGLQQLLAYTRADMELEGYKPHPKIKAEVSV